MILVHQRYFAKPGLFDQVLETRIEASRRLSDLGVPVGQIWIAQRDVPGSPRGNGPDLIWECSYPTLEERERVRVLSRRRSAFHAIRTRQSGQLVHWARELYRLVK